MSGKMGYVLLHLCNPKDFNSEICEFKCFAMSYVILTNNHHSQFHLDAHYSEYRASQVAIVVKPRQEI